MNLSGIPARSLFGRLLRAPLKLVPPAARIPILQGPLRGKRWIVGSATHGCWLGSYEERKQRQFASHVSPGQVVFDVGANVGFYTLLAAVLTGPNGRVVAVEPVPRNLGYLRRHLEINGIRNVEVIEAALSDIEGELKFGEGENPLVGRLDSTGSLRVQATTLDALVHEKKLPAPDLIKMDIEGGEAAALRGARETLGTYHPSIFLATHGPEVHRTCRLLLGAAGYDVRALGGGDADATDELIAVHPAANRQPG